jgi:hypothetical protein
MAKASGGRPTGRDRAVGYTIPTGDIGPPVAFRTVAVNTGPSPGWWPASDGRWYPPELHPNYRPDRDQVPSGSHPQRGFGPPEPPNAFPGRRLSRWWWLVGSLAVLLAVVAIAIPLTERSSSTTIGFTRVHVGRWSIDVYPSLGQEISCASVHRCMVVGYSPDASPLGNTPPPPPLYSTTDGTHWTKTLIGGNTYAPNVACPPRAFRCLMFSTPNPASGEQFGQVAFGTNTYVRVATPAIVGHDVALADVSCTSAQWCEVDPNNPSSDTTWATDDLGKTWSILPLPRVEPAGFALQGYDMTCASSGTCTMSAGRLDIATRTYDLYVATSSAAAPPWRLLIDPLTSRSASEGIYCWTASACEAFTQSFVGTEPQEQVQMTPDGGASWSAPVNIGPINGEQFTRACDPRGNCIVTGGVIGLLGGWAATQNGSRWTTTTVRKLAAVYSMSCPAPFQCSAIGQGYEP